MNPEKPEGGVPPEEQFDDEGNEKKPEGELRTPEEMKGELRAYIEMREFPNRMEIFKNRTDEIVDMDGKPLPHGERLVYQANRDGVKMRGDTIYGEYMDDRGNTYWVKLGDADYWASRVHGYTKARPE